MDRKTGLIWDKTQTHSSIVLLSVTEKGCVVWFSIVWFIKQFCLVRIHNTHTGLSREPLTFQMRKLILEEANSLSQDTQPTGQEVVVRPDSLVLDPFNPQSLLLCLFVYLT